MIAIGRRAPDFEGTDDVGNRIRLRELRGRPVVLHFFAVAWSGT